MSRYDEDDYLPVSALQHFVYCSRRAALHLTECQWADNVFTAEGTVLHHRADDPVQRVETRGDLRIVRGFRLFSPTLGLTGIADVIEFHRVKDPVTESNDPLSFLLDDDDDMIPKTVTHTEKPLWLDNQPVHPIGWEGAWRPFPIEYKRGKQRREPAYNVQLCAQALCIEECFDSTIRHGAIFYGKSDHRMPVEFDETLRRQTIDALLRLRDMLNTRATPPARFSKKCGKCSMKGLCLPKASKRTGVQAWLQNAMRDAKGELL